MRLEFHLQCTMISPTNSVIVISFVIYIAFYLYFICFLLIMTLKYVNDIYLQRNAKYGKILCTLKNREKFVDI